MMGKIDPELRSAPVRHGRGQSQPVDPRPERNAVGLAFPSWKLTSMINAIVAGAAGRMGSRLIALIKESGTLALAGASEGKGHPGAWTGCR